MTATDISFDEFARIRLLNSQEFDASEKLKEECKDFTSSKKGLTPFFRN